MPSQNSRVYDTRLNDIRDEFLGGSKCNDALVNNHNLSSGTLYFILAKCSMTKLRHQIYLLLLCVNLWLNFELVRACDLPRSQSSL
jgi:hypothetical protein